MVRRALTWEAADRGAPGGAAVASVAPPPPVPGQSPIQVLAPAPTAAPTTAPNPPGPVITPTDARSAYRVALQGTPTPGAPATPATPSPAPAPTQTPVAAQPPAQPATSTSIPAVTPSGASSPPSTGASPDPSGGAPDFQFSDEKDPASPEPAPATPIPGAPPASPPTPEPIPPPGDIFDETVRAYLADPANNPDGLTNDAANFFRKAFLRSQGGREMLTARNFLRELTAPPDPQNPSAGGLGRAPNVNEVLSAFSDAEQLAQIQYDYAMAAEDPRAAQSFVSRFFAPDERGQHPPQAQHLLRGLVENLAHQSQQGSRSAATLYQEAITDPVAETLFRQLAFRIAAIPDNGGDSDAERERRVFLHALPRFAAMLGYEFDAQALVPARPGTPAAAQALSSRQPDPREQEILQRERRIREQEEALQSRAVTEFRRGVDAQVVNFANRLVDEALAQVRNQFPTDAAYLSVRDGYRREALQLVNRDPKFNREYNIALSRAKNSPIPFSPASAAEMYRIASAPMREAIRSLRSRYVSTGTMPPSTSQPPQRSANGHPGTNGNGVVISTPQQVAQMVQNAQYNSPVVSNGTPGASVAVPAGTSERQSGESAKDYFRRAMGQVQRSA